MPRKTNGFTDWVGKRREDFMRWNAGRADRRAARKKAPPPLPATLPPTPAGDEQSLTLQERMEQRFENLMQEVDDLSADKPTLEEHAEYGWIVLIRLGLPALFFILFGYEDGLFMTGFQNFRLEGFILLMYGIGYGLEGLRTALVYSMGFSRTEGRRKAGIQQFIFWMVMSLGCGVAQLASALVIQALGADQSITGNDAVSRGASVILAKMPSIIYIAIGIRVVLCAVADWACSSFLHKKKPTLEQKVTSIKTRAENFSTLLQAQNTANTIMSNARHYEEVVADEREDLKTLRAQQKKLTDMAFERGVRELNRVVEEDRPGLPSPEEE